MSITNVTSFCFSSGAQLKLGLTFEVFDFFSLISQYLRITVSFGGNAL